VVAAGAADFAPVAGAELVEFAPFFESHPESAIGTHRLQPSASAPRNTTLRGGVSSFIIHSPSGEIGKSMRPSPASCANATLQ
jgi:hypothetical protein